MDRKLGGGYDPFGEEELGPHLTQCGQAEAYLQAKFHFDPSNHLATVHQHYRQDNGPIAQGEPFYKRSLKNVHWTIKKRDILFLTIALANLNRFLYF